MYLISVTRLRVRSLRFMPMFAWHAWSAVRQIKTAPGFQGGALLPDRHRVFWTMTAWDDEPAMRAYMMGGLHRTAMPHLANWCDEAAVVHWHNDAATLPTWPDAAQHMRETGRPSNLRFPGPQHASLNFASPRLSRGAKIRK